MKRKFSTAAATWMLVTTATVVTPAIAGSQAQTSSSFGTCEITSTQQNIKLQTVEKDTLTVATILPNPGWWNGMSPDTINGGFEYCLAANIASRAGLHHIRIKNISPAQFFSGMATGYDVAIASTTITEPRKKVFNFSRPYFTSNLGVATKVSGDVTEGNIRNKRIGVLQGNVGSDWVANVLKPQTKVSVYQAQEDMFTALMAGQIDAVVTDTTLALTQAKASNGVVHVPGQFKVDQGYGVITPRGSVNTQPVDTAVGSLASDGTLKRLSATYLQPKFGVDPSQISFWSVR
ncbi:amino acid ABC transporter substrate-binding protein [Burkholderia sp. Bp9017]|uniref:ABC transporter substrate-binding protein n=1 Tax=unclassified Burkholderia TaxID=2613784 RepID=UPI000F5FDB8D|nr:MULTISPECIES: ABC transporter substrate-binding protein [unclassified Burkholderia]RQZ15011.1 amino acid ABC transporter substrate-binding protein [Burkholderia sp. Bp9017]RQZ26603.1 amino acid ABC transporter substrate-binding protein [Burkholderia sp. Bp9016]